MPVAVYTLKSKSYPLRSSFFSLILLPGCHEYFCIVKIWVVRFNCWVIYLEVLTVSKSRITIWHIINQEAVTYPVCLTAVLFKLLHLFHCSYIIIVFVLHV